MSARSRRVVAAVACGVACLPTPASGAELLPDLVAEPARDRGLHVIDGRLLLRFDGYIRNVGAGPAELVGSSPKGGVLTVVEQWTYDEAGAKVRELPTAAVVRYENHQTHSHFHLQSAARYSLWTEDRLWEVIGSEKAGFCLTDSFHSEPGKGPSSARYAPDYCSQGNPAPLLDVVMGISPGWRDDYAWSLAYQWLDVSSLRPGRYRLGTDIDPDRFVLESDEVNPVAFRDEPSIVPGYLPRSQRLGTVNPFVPLTIRLTADRFERPGDPVGPPAFAVTRAPVCGRLERTSATVLVYRTAPNCRGRLGFQFSAADSTSAFPRQPPTAGVRFRLGPRRALSRPRATLGGKALRVRVRSRYAGRVRASLLSRGRRLGSCSRRARANRVMACPIRLRGGARLGGTTLRVSLVIGGRVVSSRSVPLSRPRSAAQP